MSELSDRVSGSIMIADFVNVDQAGKFNVIGGGIAVVPVDPTRGSTAPLSVIARVICPVPIPDDEASIELLLADASGDVVSLPSPIGAQAIRVAQNVRFETITIPGLAIPKGSIDAAAQIVMNFGGGLPLQPGLAYTWRLHVDHELIASAPFYVPGPTAGPVIG